MFDDFKAIYLWIYNTYRIDSITQYISIETINNWIPAEQHKSFKLKTSCVYFEIVVEYY